MKPAWTPDFEVDSELAMRLINRIFPEMRVQDLKLLGIGWDNSAYLADGKIVFRFPRKSVAAELMNTEMITLPGLAKHISLPIPIPTLIGPPTSAYPYPFSGARYIPGVTACSADLTHKERTIIAAPLAKFLRELHTIEITENDLAKRLRQLEERLDKSSSVGSLEPEDVVKIRIVAEELAQSPPPNAPLCWVHGDLYARHLLIDDVHKLCGVIDWGDVHLGDRALDLSIVYSFLPVEARPAFFEEYGEIDNNTLKRARFRALSYGVILLDYGSEVGDQALVEAGRYALTQIIRKGSGR
jgi:aminoglycoside phosphotransferase (APT) family kinase protein